MKNCYYLCYLFFALLSTSYALTKEEGEYKRRSSIHYSTLLTDSCPYPSDIAPCVCTNDGVLIMDCSLVTDEAQLRNVFESFFPVSAFYKFVMRGNKDIEVLEDGVFGDVTFEVIDVQDGALGTVRERALTGSVETLRQVKIKSTQLALFPFELVRNFTSLTDMDLSHNMIYLMLLDPTMSSSSLESLDLGYNYLSYIPHEAFSRLTALQTINLSGNKVIDFTPSTFTTIPCLSTLSLSDNIMSHLPSNAFKLQPNGFLDLHNNYLSSVEVDAFKGVMEPSQINFSNNSLTMFKEEVWRSVLERDITIKLQGNSLSCGCVVAWLVKDPHLLSMVQDGACADGTLLADLNPDDFDICD